MEASILLCSWYTPGHCDQEQCWCLQHAGRDPGARGVWCPEAHLLLARRPARSFLCKYLHGRISTFMGSFAGGSLLAQVPKHMARTAAGEVRACRGWHWWLEGRCLLRGQPQGGGTGLRAGVLSSP